MKWLVFLIVFTVSCIILAGCGETLSGLGKDVNRMGRGVNTFFFRQP